jgi:hypothetical protein
MAIIEYIYIYIYVEPQSLVKSVRVRATLKMIPPVKILYKSHTIDSRALKNI